MRLSTTVLPYFFVKDRYIYLFISKDLTHCAFCTNAACQTESKYTQSNRLGIYSLSLIQSVLKLYILVGNHSKRHECKQDFIEAFDLFSSQISFINLLLVLLQAQIFMYQFTNFSHFYLICLADKQKIKSETTMVVNNR